MRAAQRLIDYTTRHYSSADTTDMKLLRRRLMQAGIYDPHGTAYFFLARFTMAGGLAFAVFFMMPMFGFQGGVPFWLFIMSGGVLGYLAPSFYLDRRIGAKRAEHQAGFPDFMDLLVVCADAGLSMEASLDRVGRELGDSYPSLAANIHMANLEIRAGRTMAEALEHLGDRLGLDEARSFATLIQQSDELGSSISDALRVYSDDMRHKRLSRAEEKAYSLPAKLALPMMVCIFPVLFVVILCPVIVRMVTGNW
jgi:tight adherence protein C